MPFVLGPIAVLNMVIGLAALALEIAAFVIALKASPAAYIAAGKLSKGAWLAITTVALVVGLAAAPLPAAGSNGRFGGLLSIASVVAALVFLVDVRPALKRYGGSAGRSQGGPNRTGGW
ncbi:MAG: DUF2516 family protein [Bifidobacteriaceae bacterium]|jgi:hypothetical protein|nr:DUF2516 family protein [Bifidobacteriaceae bacterium]